VEENITSVNSKENKRCVARPTFDVFLKKVKPSFFAVKKEKKLEIARNL